MIEFLNRALNTIFGIVFFPFRLLGPAWGLIVFSMLTGLMMLLIFKRVSDQEKIRRVKDGFKAHLLALRLYRDDPLISLQVLKDLLVNNVRYLTLAVKPLLFLMLPVMIVFVQLSSRYGHRPLRVDEATIVHVELNEEVSPDRVVLHPSDGFRVESPPLRVPGEDVLYWRVRAVQPGIHVLDFQYEDTHVYGTLQAGAEAASIAPILTDARRVKSLLYPSGKHFREDAFAREVGVRYAHRDLRIAGMMTNWLVVFLVVSILTGFLLKGIFHVEI